MLIVGLLLGNLWARNDELFNEFSLILTVLVLILLGGLAILYLLPVWVLRTRIRDAKQAQLDLISGALSGNAVAFENIIAVSPDEPLTRSDLLTRQMFIESRWEWPIAAHVQQLIIFGLLPPSTWVLAAVVENLLY